MNKEKEQELTDLLEHYPASFQSITKELEIVKELFTVFIHKDEKLGSRSVANEPNEIQ